MQQLYVDKQHLQPLRQRYCRQRLPDLGKYSWRIIREEYQQMASAICDGMYDTEFTFSTLQDSGEYDT